ncbi:MAG: FlgD immunoglobulin-like domain containing protein [bacterium]
MKLLKTKFVFNVICICIFFFIFISGISFAAPAYWREGSAKRINGAAPSVVTTLADGTTAIFYSDQYSINIATSSDGLTFTKAAYENVVSTQSAVNLDDTNITSCDIMFLAGGPQYRMTYAAKSSTGVYSFNTATSNDAVIWSTSTGISPFMIETGSTFIDSPVIISTTVASIETWYMYYTRDKNGGNQEADYVIAVASSTNNGSTWKEVSSSVISEQSKDPEIVALSNGTYRMYYVGKRSTGESFGALWSALSTDLVTFTSESSEMSGTTTSSPSDKLSHPEAVKLSDGYSYRMYYGYELSGGTTNTLTLRTTSPYLVSISPTYGSNDAAVNVTVTGEIFDNSPTIKLSRAGQTDITAATLTRVNDTTITGTFNIISQVTGLWDITVTNANTESAAMARAFTIQTPAIPTGTVEVSENIFDPNAGQAASISYTIFGEGKVTIKIYTILGELVKTIVDTTKTSGSYTENWDGKNSRNDTVASGIYIMHISGPSLEKVKKIAVVK